MNVQGDQKVPVQQITPLSQHTRFLPHSVAQSDRLATDRQGQGDTRLTLTPSVIPSSNYVIVVSAWNCLKCFCVFLYCNHQVHRDFWSPCITYHVDAGTMLGLFLSLSLSLSLSIQACCCRLCHLFLLRVLYKSNPVKSTAYDSPQSLSPVHFLRRASPSTMRVFSSSRFSKRILLAACIKYAIESEA
jgi:hypothetical protein